MTETLHSVHPKYIYGQPEEKSKKPVLLNFDFTNINIKYSEKRIIPFIFYHFTIFTIISIWHIFFFSFICEIILPTFIHRCYSVSFLSTVSDYPHEKLSLSDKPLHIAVDCQEQVISVITKGDANLRVHIFDIVDVCKQVRSSFFKFSLQQSIKTRFLLRKYIDMHFSLKKCRKFVVIKWNIVQLKTLFYFLLVHQRNLKMGKFMSKINLSTKNRKTEKKRGKFKLFSILLLVIETSTI